MTFNPNNCPTAQDHPLVEFCGNCGYQPTGEEDEEFWFDCKHLRIYKDIPTDVVIARCSVCGGYECPITIGDLAFMLQNDHPKEDHEDPSKPHVSA